MQAGEEKLSVKNIEQNHLLGKKALERGLRDASIGQRGERGKKPRYFPMLFSGVQKYNRLIKWHVLLDFFSIQ